MIKIGIIGCGYWGPNYVRIINELDGCQAQYCCDLEEKNLLKIKKIFHGTKIFRDYREMIKLSDVDAVVIATPLDSHYEIARFCMNNNKHVLVEKPFTYTVREAQSLIRASERNNVILMAGHVYECNPGVQKLKEIIEEGKLGELCYVHAERMGLGPIRKHADVLRDLATHDISIAVYLLNALPKEITAVGGSYIQRGTGDVVFLSLKFQSGLIYNISASWIAPEKIRKTTVVGTMGMAVFDDINKAELLKIYERQIRKEMLDSTPEYNDHQLVVSIGSIYIPKIEQTEPLKNQLLRFLEAVSRNDRSLANLGHSLKIVEILEMAEMSLKKRKVVRCR